MLGTQSFDMANLGNCDCPLEIITSQGGALYVTACVDGWAAPKDHIAISASSEKFSASNICTH